MPAQISDLDPQIVTLSHPSGSSARVYLYGATVVSWKVDDKERLFVSKKAILNETKAIRGGIPIVFPNFGKVQGDPLPQHGFARITKWQWLGASVDNENETTVEFGLGPTHITPDQRAMWPHPFQLRYTVSLLSHTLKTFLEVHNDGNHHIYFNTLLHTYLSVPDVTQTTIHGLKNVTFIDKVTGGTRATESRETVTVSGEVDRVYADGIDEVRINLGTSDGGYVIEKVAMRDVVVWNPWIEKAKGMADFGDDEYRFMLCVEVGSVAKLVELAEGDKWIGGQSLTVV